MDGNKPLRLEMGEIELKTGFVFLTNFFSFYLLNYFIIAYPWWRSYMLRYPEYMNKEKKEKKKKNKKKAKVTTTNNKHN